MDFSILQWFIVPLAGGIIYLASKIKDSKYSGLITTVVIHGVLVLLLIILPGFKSDSVFPNEGLQVALGYDIDGGNSGMLTAEGSDNSTPPPPEQASGDNALDQETVTDNNSESDMVVPDKNNKKPAPQTNTKNNTTTTKPAPKVPERTVDQSSTYKKNKGVKNGNDGGNPDGNGQGGNDTGNKGKNNGTIDGNPDGTGTGPKGPGTGDQAYLKGRPAKSLPKITSDFEEAGILKFEVVVSPDGKVKSLRKIAPSTITNYNQIERMKKLILSSLIFAAKPDAEDDEIGTYTIRFERK